MSNTRFDINFFSQMSNTEVIWLLRHHYVLTNYLRSCSLFQVEPDYTEETVSLSSYPLSGALTCAKLCTAFEQAWDIV